MSPPRRSGRRYPLVLYTRMLDRWWPALFLIGLSRYPAALMILGQAIESAIKAGLRIPERKYLSFFELTKRAEQAIKIPPEISGSLEQFRKARNDFSHYGFSPKDDV